MTTKKAKEKERPVRAAANAETTTAERLLQALDQVRGQQQQARETLDALSITASNIARDIEGQLCDLGDGVTMRLALLEGDVLVGNLAIGKAVQSLDVNQMLALSRWLRAHLGE